MDAVRVPVAEESSTVFVRVDLTEVPGLTYSLEPSLLRNARACGL